jgi:hypothetical protein
MTRLVEYVAVIAVGLSFAGLVAHGVGSMISDSLNTSAALIENAGR